MHTDSEWKAFDPAAVSARQRPARVEKLAYRAPGTVSVPAQAEASVPAGETPAAEYEAAIVGLEGRLRDSESGAAAKLEQLRRESREALDAVRGQAEEQARQAIQSGAEQVGAALRSFAAEREAYFARVEHEVVKLALAIAARILHREAQLDPLLLAGVARVALGQLGETTGVRLRCPVAQVERWREMLRLLPGPATAPEVSGDAEMAAGECVLEARIGTVDLGVRAQLEEIERGFFDLLEQRPGALPRPGESVP